MSVQFSILFSLFFWFISNANHAAIDFAVEVTPAKDKLNYGGTLMADAVPNLLVAAFKNHSRNADFKNSACLTVKQLSTEGSFNTIQLFAVQSVCASSAPVSYIIKEARHGEKEALALKQVASFPALTGLLAPQIAPKNELNLAVPIAHFMYRDNSNQEHILTVMPFAKGRVLCDVIKDFRDNQNAPNVERIKIVYNNFGKQLANFHRKNKKDSTNTNYQAISNGLLHGDLHCLNVFYDEKDQVATLIDNETIADSIKSPQSPDDDILKLFLGAFSQYEAEARKNYLNGVDPKKWFDIAFRSFIEGYASSFPQNEQVAVFMDLKKIFNANNFPSWFSTSPAQIQTIKNDYVNPILDEKILKR